MNSALQCLSNTPDLLRYFLQRWHIDDINYHNKDGTGGKLTNNYQKLLQTLWNSRKGYWAPWDFKDTLSDHAVWFEGYDQHDSFELLQTVLNFIHEDLNKVKKKKYINIPDTNGRSEEEVSQEQWDIFCRNNNSIIVDLLYGRLKSKITCSDCNDVNLKFDEFNTLSIPIWTNPQEGCSINLLYYPPNYVNETPVLNCKISAPSNMTLKILSEKLRERLADGQELNYYTEIKPGSTLSEIPLDTKIGNIENTTVRWYNIDMVGDNIEKCHFMLHRKYK